ncbi:MAG: Gfo/Idh/MocA family oxidoreductase [Candidatus Glassbacteria bacterium]|nr:Gfo/Idh/MocA family oxidoreductase [Candidatus Glassbacteria bacterium]
MACQTNGKNLDRRQFFSAAAGGLAGAALTLPASSAARVPGANDRISVGIIGCGNRADSFIEPMAGFMREENFEFTALCDVWKVNLERMLGRVSKATGSTPRTFSRYQDLLALKEVDAVMICTPDHAHSTILAAACEAGKDAFCEKPMSMNMAEANQVLDAVRRSGRVVQIGTQRRSDGIYMAGAELVRTGKLGRVSVVELKWNDAGPRWERQYDDVRQEDVDWQGYLMHLPARPFDPRRFRCWHLYRDYSIGVVGLLGAHHTDLVHWYMDDPFPESVAATGGTLVWKDREHYDTMHCSFKYPKGFLVSYETRLGNSSMRAEAMFYGTGGLLDTRTWTATGEGRVLPGRLEPGNRQYPTSAFAMHDSAQEQPEIKLEPSPDGIDHMRNWIQCLRSRKTPNAPVESGYSHSVAAIMAHRAADTGKRMVFDPAGREIREG